MIPVKVIMVTGTKARTKASLMFTRICNYLSILSTILSLAIIGTGFFTYKYVTSPEFERNFKNKIMGDLEKKMPKLLEKKMPKFTGKSLPL